MQKQRIDVCGELVPMWIPTAIYEGYRDFSRMKFYDPLYRKKAAFFMHFQWVIGYCIAKWRSNSRRARALAWNESLRKQWERK